MHLLFIARRTIHAIVARWKCGFPLILHHTGDVTAAQSSVQYASIVGNRLRKCCQSEVGLVYSRKEDEYKNNSVQRAMIYNIKQMNAETL